MFKKAIRKLVYNNDFLYGTYKMYRRLFPVRVGIGIDLGVKELAVLSTGKVYHSVNKSPEVKKLNREYNLAYSKKQYLKAKGIYKKIENIRYKYIDDVVKEIVSLKPKYISIEDLNFNYTAKSCKKNSLHKAIKDQHFEYFKSKLTRECRKRGIQLRMIPKHYPSSKTCSKCGYVNNNLTLADRVYICPKCKSKPIDRDWNAAINICNCKQYKILVR